MNEKLLKKYLKYAGTDEAFAVLFIKKHIDKAKGQWVDIVDCQRYEMSPDNLHFRFVVGGLYQRKLLPKYPPRSQFTVNGRFDEHRYMLMVRAITWETAHQDIDQQKSKRIAPRKFKVTGVSYDKNRKNRNFFREDAPPEVKALAKNINDRTDPLWGIALRYANGPEYVYKIKQLYLAPRQA